MERKSGYYWVKVFGDEEWVIGRYWSSIKIWDLMKTKGIRDAYFEEIDETPIVKNKTV